VGADLVGRSLLCCGLLLRWVEGRFVELRLLVAVLVRECNWMKTWELLVLLRVAVEADHCLMLGLLLLGPSL